MFISVRGQRVSVQMKNQPGLATSSSSKQSSRTKQSITTTSVLASGVLAILKLVVGTWTGSLGLLAEAAHSLLDLVSTLITFMVIRVAAVPPDSNHPYGHERAEHLGALAGMFLLAGTGAFILFQAFERIFLHPVSPEVNVWSFAVLFASLIVDFWRSRTLRRAALDYTSDALAADAEHFTNDMWGSVAVLVGFTVVSWAAPLRLPSWLIGRIDALAALIVASIAFRSVWKLGSRAVRSLMDDVPADLLNRLQKRVEAVNGVVPGTVMLRTRYVGSRPHVEVRLGAARGTTLESAHQLTEGVEKAIGDEIGNAEAIVQVEPTAAPNETCAAVVRATADLIGLRVHNLNIYLVARETRVELDLEVPDTLTLEDAHRHSESLERAIRQEIASATQVTVHLDPRNDEPRPAVRHLPSRRHVQEALTKIPEAAGVQVADVLVTDEGLVVTLQKDFNGKTPVGEAHDLMARLERDIRSSVPEVVRVHINPDIAKN